LFEENSVVRLRAGQFRDLHATDQRTLLGLIALVAYQLVAFSCGRELLVRAGNLGDVRVTAGLPTRQPPYRACPVLG
jgi:hypothetical protein